MGGTFKADRAAPEVGLVRLAAGPVPLVHMFFFWGGPPMGLAGLRSREDRHLRPLRVAPDSAEAEAAVCDHSDGAAERQIG
jgi:hypothetical protein